MNYIAESVYKWFYGNLVIRRRNAKLNVAETAHKMLLDLKANGFHKSRIDGMEYEGIWNEHYAIFQVWFWRNDYQFRKAFEKHVQDLFPNCKVTFYPDCHEIEIQSNEYDAWWAEHAEAVEEFADKNWDENKAKRKTEPVIFTP